MAKIDDLVNSVLEKPDWSYKGRTGLLTYRDCVIVNFDRQKVLYRPYVFTDVSLIRLVYTIQNQRNKGYTKEALNQIVDAANASGCSLLAVVSPFRLKRKSVFDISVAMRQLAANQIVPLEPPESITMIARMQKLLSSVGLVSGYDFGEMENGIAVPKENAFAFVPDSADTAVKEWFDLMLNEVSVSYFDDEVPEPTRIAG